MFLVNMVNKVNISMSSKNEHPKSASTLVLWGLLSLLLGHSSLSLGLEN